MGCYMQKSLKAHSHTSHSITSSKDSCTVWTRTWNQDLSLSWTTLGPTRTLRPWNWSQSSEMPVFETSDWHLSQRLPGSIPVPILTWLQPHWARVLGNQGLHSMSSSSWQGQTRRWWCICIPSPSQGSILSYRSFSTWMVPSLWLHIVMRIKTLIHSNMRVRRQQVLW